jgi:Calpain family cysteine protease
MRAVVTGWAFGVCLLSGGCGAEVAGDTEGAEQDVVGGGLAEPETKSGYRHLPLHGVGEAFVQGSRDIDKIDPSDVSQGHINDCWVMSALISIARTNPGAIERLVSRRPDGNYDVTLYVGGSSKDEHGVVHRAPKVISVAPTFVANDQGDLMYAQPQDVGPHGPELWPLLIEKAYAAHLGRYEGPIPVWGRDLSGNDVPAFHALLPEGDFDTYNPSRQDDDRIVEVIGKAFDEHRPTTGLVTFMFDASVGDKYGIVTWHHYAIAGIDRAAKTIDLEDPVRHRTGAKGLPVADFRRAFTFYHVGPVVR